MQNVSCDKVWIVREAVNSTAICELIFYTIYDQLLTTLYKTTACYGVKCTCLYVDDFTSQEICL
jgi:hypothetical protein